jgi:ubiquinone/menaquinone biosynthesis C-methylase UbiE
MAKKITVIDPSRNQLSRVTNNKINTLQGDGCNLPIKNKSYDVVLLISVLHHLKREKQNRALQEANRILKDKGTLFIIEPWFPKKIIPQLFKKIERIITGETYHIKPEDLEKTLEKVGFQTINMIFPKDHDWKYAAKVTR